ncbi:aminopeptidase, partial [Eggerthella lenta]|nr:aminopeptidase [Eggerthella lenta]
MDAELYKTEALLGIDYVMNKKERLETRQACVSHAMTLTGFNEADGQIDRWKIENSWGEENGEKGYFVMTQKWFEDYT